MNFYDKIHELVKCLKDTPEYTNYIQIKAKVKQDEELKNKILEFKKRQTEEQVKYINGKEMDDATKQEMQQMYSLIIQNPLAVDFFQAEIKLDVILADMQKIIAEGVKEIVEF